LKKLNDAKVKKDELDRKKKEELEKKKKAD